MKPSHPRPPAWQPWLQQAVALHRSGRTVEAKARYEQVLKANPRQPEALHFLGLLCVDTGAAPSALPLLQNALRLNPGAVPVMITLARALVATGNADEALALLDSALGREPRNTEALFQRALLLHGRGDLTRAIDAYRTLVAADASIAVAHFNLGTLLRTAGRLEEARAALTRALELNPRFAPAAINLGCVAQDQGRHDEAAEILRKALALDGKSAEGHVALATSLRALGRNEEAADSSRRAIGLRPEFAAAYTGLAQALASLGRETEAEEAYRTALTRAPHSIDALNNLGNLLRQRGQLGESRTLLAQALSLQPANAALSLNLGMSLHQLGHLDEAESLYRQALALSPALDEAGLNLAMARLTRGDFHEGWKLYEHRWQGDLRNAVRSFDRPEWDGHSSLQGRTLLLHAEQGLGDTIQFSRFVPALSKAGARVVLELQAPLSPLMGSLDGLAQRVVRGAPLPPFDLHCPLLSVPRLIDFDPTQSAAPQSYLRAPADAAERWRPRIDALPHPRIGWVWSGNPRHKNDRNRSVPYALVRSIASATPGSHLSLQIDYREGDREALARDRLLTDLSATLNDFSDTAAIVEHLDLVISVDTSVAHLAGALGRPVWILLPFCPDWRWLQSGATSPWYPSARLFRQPAPGDWDSVAAEVAATLRTENRNFSP